jgi:hypothetical protein
MPPELTLPAQRMPTLLDHPPTPRGKAAAQSHPIRTVWTPEEAAGYLRVSPATMANWRTTGEGPRFLRPARRVIRYYADECQRWVESRGLVSSTTEADGREREAA